MAEAWANLVELVALPKTGLIPAIIQDEALGVVLMLVSLDREALTRIAETGRIHYFHPQKRKVVAKGENSGHFQEVTAVRLNCQGDQLLFRVRPAGGACELGYHSCFFRQLGPHGWEPADPKTFNPEETYPEWAFSH